MKPRAIIQFSGGAASYVAAKFAIEDHGPDHVVLLFADTLAEDEDLYRFLDDASRRLNIPITRICEGRTPWQVFFDERMIGNTRLDPCSRTLKRRPLRQWLEDHADPDTDTVVIGYDAAEEHRFQPLQQRYAPWAVRAPLIERGVFKETALDIVAADGLRVPRLYAMGFPHNNCGGACVKAGQATWALLLRHAPERYAEQERHEERFRAMLGKDVAILRDRRGGSTKPLTLRALRERAQQQPDLINMFDYGGCACMEPPEVSPGPGNEREGASDG